MVWNKELKREILEGWEGKKLSDIINILSDRIKIKEIEDIFYMKQFQENR